MAHDRDMVVGFDAEGEEASRQRANFGVKLAPRHGNPGVDGRFALKYDLFGAIVCVIAHDPRNGHRFGDRDLSGAIGGPPAVDFDNVAHSILSTPQ